MWYFNTAILVVILDQLTKWWVVSSFQLYESREVIHNFFNLVYVRNSGAAFSILANVESIWRHYFFVGIGFIALIVLTIMYFKMRAENTYYFLPLGLIAGGACGNLIDRLHSGSVVDFLDFIFGSYHWPSFNVADSAICVGACILLVLNFIDKPEKSIRMEN